MPKDTALCDLCGGATPWDSLAPIDLTCPGRTTVRGVSCPACLMHIDFADRQRRLRKPYTYPTFYLDVKDDDAPDGARRLVYTAHRTR